MAIRTADVAVPRGNFEAGDIVQLVTGGPDMTVAGACDDCGMVNAVWFNFDEEAGWVYYDEVFPAVALELAA
jgi:uncharacterized protein YodC (DUF2158 family)